MGEVLIHLTYCDMARAGNCLSGIIEWCTDNGVWHGQTEELIEQFQDDAHNLKFAANMDGDGYGDGDLGLVE